MKMRVAVSAAGNTLDSPVDPRFGRCAYFIIADVEGNEIKNVEAIQNPAMSARGGAGIQAAQLIASNKVEVLITGNIGPNAAGVLSSTGIKIVISMPGISVKEAIEKYLKGELGEVQGPTMGFGGFGAGRRMGFGRRFQ
jgi:predicted Fe-Mo cluster-binding NifX family protein